MIPAEVGNVSTMENLTDRQLTSLDEIELT